MPFCSPGSWRPTPSTSPRHRDAHERSRPNTAPAGYRKDRVGQNSSATPGSKADFEHGSPPKPEHITREAGIRDPVAQLVLPQRMIFGRQEFVARSRSLILPQQPRRERNACASTRLIDVAFHRRMPSAATSQLRQRALHANWPLGEFDPPNIRATRRRSGVHPWSPATHAVEYFENGLGDVRTPAVLAAAGSRLQPLSRCPHNLSASTSEPDFKP